ncbi:MAG: alkyl hydroperoxide reductase, partial [Actinomycetia bacterium]|nr:alkyl hydroperoxide reductase [Actinomycetes bacterium]
FLAAALLASAAVAGCSSSDSADTLTPPQTASFTGSGFPPCPAQTGPPLGTPTALPHLTLPCMDGGGSYTLDRAPAVPLVVNLWGSWCPPCAKELPVMQRLHERGAGKVEVLGIVTKDSASSSIAAAKDLRLTFPNVFDPQDTVERALGRISLPITVFVDPTGRVKGIYNGIPLTDATLRAQVQKYLGVDVP